MLLCKLHAETSEELLAIKAFKAERMLAHPEGEGF